MEFKCSITWQNRIQMSLISRKSIFGVFRPGMTQTRLLGHRGYLKSWNFWFSKYRYYTILVAQIRLCRCAGWSALLLFAYGIRQVSLWCGSNIPDYITKIGQFEPWHDKTNKMSVRPAKTQISLGIHAVWSESWLSTWRKLGSLATHWAHSEDWSDWADAQADQSLRWAHTHFVGFVMSRLICRKDHFAQFIL